MKKITLVSIVLFAAIISNAQNLGIGNITHSGTAQFYVSGTTKALAAGKKMEVHFFQNTCLALNINNRKTRFQGFKIN